MKNKILCFILPSRDRLEMLKETLEELSLNFKDNLTDIEVIVKLDTDDYVSHKILNEKFEFEIKYIISDKLRGYPSIPDFMNQCYKLSDSYFLIFYNDDTTITNNYNLIEKLKEIKDVVSIVNNSPTAQFPIIHYKILEITNGFNKDVIYVDGHYNAVKILLPKENQFELPIDFVHPRYGYNEIHHRRENEMKNHQLMFMEFFDGNFFVNKDASLINDYLSKNK